MTIGIKVGHKAEKEKNNNVSISVKIEINIWQVRLC